MFVVILFPVPGYSDSSEKGKWSVSACYAPIYEFNAFLLNEVFDDSVGPGIADAKLSGVSFDYKMGENVSISLGFSFAENSVNGAGKTVVPRNDAGTNTYTWDVVQNIDFKAFTVSFLRKIGPANKVVPYFGAGVGVCQVEGNTKGSETREIYVPPNGGYPGSPEYHDIQKKNYNNTFSDIYPVLDARIGLGWNVTERFMLSVEERFVNGLGTFIQGKYVF